MSSNLKESQYQRLSPEKKEKYRERAREYARRYKILNKEKAAKTMEISLKKWREKNPTKHRAHRVIAREILAGRMRKGICFCGDKNTEAHHPDYDKPFDVMWLCRPHHRKADRGELLNT